MVSDQDMVPGDEFVSVAEFLFPDEAAVARTAVESAGILCYLENDRVLGLVWGWNYALGGIRLMTPQSCEVAGREIVGLTGGSAEAEQVAIARRGRMGIAGRMLFAMCLLLTPTAYGLTLLWVSRN